MNIVPVNNNDVSMKGKMPDWSEFRKKVCQKILDTLPEATYKDSKPTLDKLKNIDERISRPAENRAIMGTTAILTQPGIDSYNPRADKETRRMSMVKDISKITVGTCVGILVRGGSYKLVEKMTDVDGKNSYSKYLLPKSNKHMSDFKKHIKLLKNYRSALSTGLAIAAMCITNFAIDMPLTLFLTNKLNEKTKKIFDVQNESCNKEVSYEKIA